MLSPVVLRPERVCAESPLTDSFPLFYERIFVPAAVSVGALPPPPPATGAASLAMKARRMLRPVRSLRISFWS